MAAFGRLELSGWRQFAHVEIDFKKQVTVLTGSNGSGKTSLLNILGHHFGWNQAFVSTPFMGKKRAKRIWSDIFDARTIEYDEPPTDAVVHIGRIDYTDGNSCSLLTQRYVEANYQLQYQNMREVRGLFIPSHRPVATYHVVKNIPTNPVSTQQHYQQFQTLLFQAFGAQPRQNPGVIQKQSLISLALFGEGNSFVAGNAEYRRVFEEFQEKLKIVLPTDIGFQRLEVRMPEVVLITASGDFALDAMSGGINAVFGFVWQIYMSGIGMSDNIVIIDEPENHLHPSMQRIILPNLARAFPGTKFIVATHSPFVVSSFPEADVFGLFPNSNRKIESTLIKADDLSGTPNEILREVLEVDSNLPVWVEERVQTIIKQYADADPNQRASLILNELAKLGISNAITEYGAKRSR